MDSNCVRRLSTSAATGSGVRPVYVDASGQVQTINYDLPSTQPLTATTSLSENGYIKFSNDIIIQWGFLGGRPNAEYTITFPIAFTTLALGFRNVGCDSRYANNCKEGSLHHIKLSSAKTQVNADHYWASWFAIGY